MRFVKKDGKTTKLRNIPITRTLDRFGNWDLNTTFKDRYIPITLPDGRVFWQAEVMTFEDAKKPFTWHPPKIKLPATPKRETPRVIKEVVITENIELEQIIQRVLVDNPKPVTDYKNGKKQSVGFLVGCVLKEVKANAAEVKMRLEREMNGEKS